MAFDVVIAGGGFGGLYADPGPHDFYVRRLDERDARTLGVFVDMGQHKAVATILGLRLRGFPAWFAARTYHLAMMPGMGRRVRLGIGWAVGLVLGRASAELGQLGHPPSLGDYLEDVSRAGEMPGT